jgi:hypothetical protein
MVLVKKGQPKEVPCVVCGKPSPTTICPHCQARIQGEAVDKKIQIEKKGKTEREGA